MGSSQAVTISHGGSVIFERVVGSLGSSLAPGDYFGPEDSSEDKGQADDSEEESSRQTSRPSSTELS